MFKNAYQSGLLSIFYSCGSKPLELWDVEVKNGHIKRVTDNEVRSIVLEIGGSNVSTTYITCPKGGKSLGITLPFMVMIVKNLKKHFTFEVTVLDETGARRRFRISNFQSTTQILPLCTTMPITLNDGWNQIQFNLAEFTTRSYKTQFMEVSKLKINANIRLRRVYFTEVLQPDEQLPPEYKLYIPPVYTKPIKVIAAEVKGKENLKPSSSKQIVQITEDKKGSKVNVSSKTGSKVSVRSIKKLSEDQIIDTIEEEKPQEAAKDEKPEDAGNEESPQEIEGAVPTEPASEETVPAGEKTEIVATSEAAPEGSDSVRAQSFSEPNDTDPTDIAQEELTPVNTTETPLEAAAPTAEVAPTETAG